MTEKRCRSIIQGKHQNCLNSKSDSSSFIGAIEHDGNRIVDNQKKTVI